MAELTLNKIFDTLQLNRLKPFYADHDKYGFTRTVCFYLPGERLKIEWYKNISSIEIKGITIRFDGFEISGSWPNKHKRDIILRLGSEPIAIIPVEL